MTLLTIGPQIPDFEPPELGVPSAFSFINLSWFRYFIIVMKSNSEGKGEGRVVHLSQTLFSLRLPVNIGWNVCTNPLYVFIEIYLERVHLEVQLTVLLPGSPRLGSFILSASGEDPCSVLCSSKSHHRGRQEAKRKKWPVLLFLQGTPTRTTSSPENHLNLS